MDATHRSRLFDDLLDAIAAMRAFLEGRDPDVRLAAAEMHTLERLAERYHRADEAVSRHVEQVIRRSTGRPRR